VHDFVVEEEHGLVLYHKDETFIYFLVKNKLSLEIQLMGLANLFI